MNIVKLLCFLLLPFSIFAKLHVYTYASDHRKELNALIRSGKKHGLNVEYNGIGKGYVNHGEKPCGLQEFLKTIDRDDIVLFLDAYDTLIMGNEDEFLKKYNSFNADVVFCAEKNCFPDQDLKEWYPESTSPHKYLNSGAFIGKASVLTDMLASLQPNKHDDDQFLYTIFYLFFDHNIRLDTSCEIFLSLESVENTSIIPIRKGRKVKYSLTNTIPLVVHGNGNGKKRYKSITKWHMIGHV